MSARRFSSLHAWVLTERPRTSRPTLRIHPGVKMSAEKITAEKRTEFGKGAARRVRAADKIPAVIYQHGDEPTHITLPGHTTMMALRHGGANALLEIDVD